VSVIPVFQIRSDPSLSGRLYRTVSFFHGAVLSTDSDLNP
jgi:hypothetical protein